MSAYRFALTRLILITCLLAACAPTPTPPTDPTATAPLPTPVVVIVQATATKPPATAREATEAYLTAWAQRDYATMYGLLAPNSRAAINQADFTSEYTKTMELMTVLSLTTQITEVVENGSTAQAAAAVSFKTQLVAEFPLGYRLNLERTGEQWGVVFDRTLVFPDFVNGQQLLMVPIIPDRGLIYDRTGTAMVTQTEVYAMGIVPAAISETTEAIESGFARLLRLPRDMFLAKFPYHDAIPEQYFPVATVAQDELGRQSYLLDTSGVASRNYTARFYYGRGAAAQVTGYTVFIPPDEQAAYQAQGYVGTERIGATGLELWGEQYLAGRVGGQLQLRDASMTYINMVSAKRSVPSQDIYTTIDFNLQKEAQFALGALNGAAVVMDINTGAILAMVSSPTYDPNGFEPQNINAVALAQDLANPGKPLINHAMQSSYPAGSIFKLVTMGAGLNSGVFSPTTEYVCDGTWEELGDDFVRTDWRENGHGTINLVEALTGSCNPYFWHIGYELYKKDPMWLSKTAREFGLGVALLNGMLEETPGVIPDPDWKQRTKGEAWSVFDSINLSIGQGDTLVTPLQIVRMAAAIGNGGTLYQPYLVTSVHAPEAPPSIEFQPTKVGELPLSAEQLAAIQEGMRQVTLEPNGTARQRFRGLPSWLKAYGKTGTAEDPGEFGTQEPNAWFTGFIHTDKADKPDIAIAVVVRNQGQGSAFAAPIFRRIMEAYYGLSYVRYPWEAAVGVPALPTPTPDPNAVPTVTP